MTSWAKVGAKCVCINDRRMGAYGVDNPCPPKSTVVCVDSIWEHPIHGQTLIIKGWPNFCEVFGCDIGWMASRFRPVITKTQEEDVAMFKRIVDEPPIAIMVEAGLYPIH